jgi:hypothetical protein
MMEIQLPLLPGLVLRCLKKMRIGRGRETGASTYLIDS